MLPEVRLWNEDEEGFLESILRLLGRDKNPVEMLMRLDGCILGDNKGNFEKKSRTSQPESKKLQLNIAN